MPSKRSNVEKSVRPSKRSFRKKQVEDVNDSDSDFENDSSNRTSKSKINIAKEEKSPYFKNSNLGVPSLENSKQIEKTPLHSLHFGHKNIVHYLYNNVYSKPGKCSRETFQSIIAKDISEFSVYRATSNFSRRVTCITWHPSLSHILAVGSKSGDLFLWDIKNEHNEFITGSGPDGTIKALKFDALNHTKVYTASVNGTVGKQDFLGKDNKVFLEIENDKDYYSALDVCTHNKTIVTGDTRGYVSLLNTDGGIIWNSRLHKQKITHVEFSPRENWVLATASLDHTVKMWDIRNMKNGCSDTLTHEKAVNSAYFSLKDGVRLLTTDQHSQLRVYRGPLWNLERIIRHPHRQFQHLTPIKAQWYPLEDIIVVGRYPDPTFKDASCSEVRSIDFFEAESGKLLYQLSQVGVTGIVSVNAFNRLGDFLASGMGMHILLWRNKIADEKPTKSRRKATSDFLFDKKSTRPQRTCKKK